MFHIHPRVNVLADELYKDRMTFENSIHEVVLKTITLDSCFKCSSNFNM